MDQNNYPFCRSFSYTTFKFAVTHLNNIKSTDLIHLYTNVIDTHYGTDNYTLCEIKHTYTRFDESNCTDQNNWIQVININNIILYWNLLELFVRECRDVSHETTSWMEDVSNIISTINVFHYYSIIMKWYDLYK